MAPQPKPPTFVARGTYRQRRLRDAARILPVFGAILVCFPLLWPRDGDDAALTSSAVIFIFGSWLLLIVLAAILARVIEPNDDADSQTGTGSGAED